jgi:hypothetical protein
MKLWAKKVLFVGLVVASGVIRYTSEYFPPT